MATLYKRQHTSAKPKRDGTPAIRIYWIVGYRFNGRNITKTFGANRSLALAFKKQIEAELTTGKFVNVQRGKSAQICDSIKRYILDIEALRKPRTAVRYENALRHFLEYCEMENMLTSKVSDITASNILQFQTWRRRQWISPNGSATVNNRKHPTYKTVDFETKVVRSWLFWSIKYGERNGNPAKYMARLKFTDSKEKRILTRDEFRMFRTASLDIEWRNRNRRGQTLFWTLLVNSGLRISELENLQWSDIEFHTKTIIVRRKPFYDPKSYGRAIPMSKDSEQVLRKLLGNEAKPADFIFIRANGKRINSSVARKWILDCAAQAGVEGVTGPHTFRHTFITWCFTEFNMDAPTVKEIAGHQRLETTQQYCHPNNDHKRLCMHRFSSE